MESNGRPIKLRCTNCMAEFYTTLSIERLKDAPCPNCREKKLEQDNEIKVNDDLIPIRD